MGLWRKKPSEIAAVATAAAGPGPTAKVPAIPLVAGATAPAATSSTPRGSHRDRTSIRTKFLLMMLPATLIGLGIITLFASQAGKKALTDAAERRPSPSSFTPNAYPSVPEVASRQSGRRRAS